MSEDDDWGYMVWGPETDRPCTDCGATPTRALTGCRGLYCQRHCRSFARFGTIVSSVIVLAIVSAPFVLVAVAAGWIG